MTADEDARTFDNLNPTPDELMELAYGSKYDYVSQDWALCVANFHHRDLYRECALDVQCRFRDLFMQVLFALVGGVVWEAKCELNRYTKRYAPLPAERVEMLKIIQRELEGIEDPVINGLRGGIDRLLAQGRNNFDYDFYFESGWIRDES